MIVKVQDITSKALVDLILFINSKRCIPEDGGATVALLKRVDPSTLSGYYSVDLDFRETYVDRTERRRPTDSKILLEIYEICTAQYT